MRGRPNAVGIRGVLHWDLAGNGCCGCDTNILKVPESILGVEIAISSNVLPSQRSTFFMWWNAVKLAEFGPLKKQGRGEAQYQFSALSCCMTRAAMVGAMKENYEAQRPY